MFLRNEAQNKVGQDIFLIFQNYIAISIVILIFLCVNMRYSKSIIILGPLRSEVFTWENGDPNVETDIVKTV